MVIFDDWFFKYYKAFCVAYGICAGIHFIHQVDLIYFCTAPSIDAWSMAEMLWQRIHTIFIFFYSSFIYFFL